MTGRSTPLNRLLEPKPVARRKPGPKPGSKRRPPTPPAKPVAVPAPSPTPVPKAVVKAWELRLPKLQEPVSNNNPDDHPYFHYGRAVPRDGSLGNEPELGFMSDFRKTNPGLHMLYVKTAVRHLRLLDAQMTQLHDESNLNLAEAIGALQHQRMVLVFSNAAYWDAEEILRGLRLEVGTRIVNNDEDQ